MKKDNVDVVEEYFLREIRPILEKVANEISPTRTSGRVSLGSVNDFFLYKPHNCRRWIQFSKDSLKNKACDSFINPGFIGNERLGSFISCRKINYDSEIFIEFERFNFTIKKNCVKIYVKFYSKTEFNIPYSKAGSEKVLAIEKDLDSISVEALKSFIVLNGGDSNFNIITRDAELKVLKDQVIDCMKKNSRWHNKVCSKVYNKHMLEFKDPLHVQNWVLSRSLQNNIPEICEAINYLADSLKLYDPVRFLKSKCKTAVDLIDFRDLILTLNKKELRDISDWGFTIGN